MICCDLCDVWHYGKSVGLSLTESQNLEKWFCSSCSTQQTRWKKLADELKQYIINEVKVQNDKAFMELRAGLFEMDKDNIQGTDNIQDQDKARQLKILQDNYDNVAKTLELKQRDLIDLKRTVTQQESSLRVLFEENQKKQMLIQNLIVTLCQKSLEEFNQTSAQEAKLKLIEAENEMLKEKLQSFKRKSKLSLGSRATRSQI